MNTEIIGKQIAALRKEKGIKQEDLAKYVSVSTQAVSKWENGGVPDTELLPKIAEFFSVSIDFLFGRNTIENKGIQAALMDKINATPQEDRIKLVFNYCWDMERALTPTPFAKGLGSVEAYGKGIADAQHYSSIVHNEGFTRMGIANRLQYFLIVPNPKDSDAAYLKDIDYTTLFKDLSDKDFWNACVFLNKREHAKAFTTTLFTKNLGITAEKATEILSTLTKYRMVCVTQIELDDEIKTVYKFQPTPSFIGLLIFAQELIDPPSIFAYYSNKRTAPYLK